MKRKSSKRLNNKPNIKAKRKNYLKRFSTKYKTPWNGMKAYREQCEQSESIVEERKVPEEQKSNE